MADQHDALEVSLRRSDGSPSDRESDHLGVNASFSYRGEIRYFLCKSMPMCLGNLMNTGIPILVAMIIAGHTDARQSAHLQGSLGYGRLWYNCTLMMPTNGMLAYYISVIPGCIGAGRKDRLPRYFQRSVVLSVCMLLPFFVLQFWAGDILSGLGVEESNANEVALYSRLMIMAAILNLLNIHFESALNNLGYVSVTMGTSLITGFCVDSTCNYVFVLKWGWGIYGAAWARIVVQVIRCALFLIAMCSFSLFRTMCVGSWTSEKLVSKMELREYFRMGIPTLLAALSGWLVFEMQILAITNIHTISKGALAAGALWVQCEGAFAAAQQGWIQSASMRSLALLGKQDPGARKAFWLFHNMSAVLVVVVNVCIVMLQGTMSNLMSNDSSVQYWLRQILWILTLHTQTRISSLITFIFYVPLGRGMLRTCVTFVSFYFVAVPIAGFIALSDAFTTSVGIKLATCVGATSVAQGLQVIANFFYLYQLDWQWAGAVIHQRANADKRDALASSGPASPPARHQRGNATPSA